MWPAVTIVLVKRSSLTGRKPTLAAEPESSERAT
jgi:hypothetical protein